MFNLYHNKDYYDMFRSMFLNSRHGFLEKYQKLFDEHMDGNIMFRCNMFIMPKSMFKRYIEYVKACSEIAMCTWDMIEDYEIIDDKYQRRMPGFMLERMTSLFLATEMQETSA